MAYAFATCNFGAALTGRSARWFATYYASSLDYGGVQPYNPSTVDIVLSEIGENITAAVIIICFEIGRLVALLKASLWKWARREGDKDLCR
jgi:hypothetical protein